MVVRTSIVASIVGLSATAGVPHQSVSVPPAPAKTNAPESPKPFKQEIPTAAASIDMVPIPGDPARGIGSFSISRTEIPWEVFDVFLFHLDDGGEQSGKPSEDAPSPDAVTRPSKPYLPPDRGFGHEGYAAITVSHANAAAFCAWLSAKSGKRYRLPLESEWELACGATPSNLDEAAWTLENSEGKPHRVATKAPNTFGLHDVFGNVAEWVDGRDGQPVIKGGSYLDRQSACTSAARTPASRSWNASDPQIPKSKWWLADAPFIGFRVVCEHSAEVPAASSTPAPPQERP